MATNLLEIVERADALELLNSKQETERKFPIEGHSDELVSIAYHPSSSYATAHTKSPKISYHKDGGIPLEVIINTHEGYSRISLKTVSGILNRYIPFSRDIYNNIGQDIRLPTTEISEVEKELKSIVNFDSSKISKENEEMKIKFGQELKAAGKLREGLDPETQLLLNAELQSELDDLIREGVLVPSISKDTGETTYGTTIKGYRIHQPTPESVQAFWPSASLEDIKSVSPKDPAAFIKQSYMSENHLFEPHIIFKLRDSGEITAEEEKILLGRYEAYEQEREKQKALNKK